MAKLPAPRASMMLAAGPRHLQRTSPAEAPPLSLPELDKADEGDEVDVGVFELDVDEGLVVGDDDAAQDAFEIDIQEQHDPGSSEAAHELDIGMGDLLDALPEPPPALASDDVPEADGELDQHLEAPLEADDPSTDAELGDDGLEALPELMADDDGDAGPEAERELLPGAPEGALARGPSLEPEWLSLGSACSALCAAGEEVLASGEQLMRFGVTRRNQPLPSGTRASSLAVLESGAVIVASPRGTLELTAGSTAALELPDGLRGSSAEVSQVAGAAALWARLATGNLHVRRGRSWAKHETDGSVRSLTSSGEGGLTLLVVGKRPTLQHSSDGGSSFRELLLAEPAATVALGGEPAALALGSSMAIADAQRGLCVSSDGGATFRMVTGAVNVTAVAIGERAGKPVVLAALYRESRDLTELVQVDPETGTAASVAELAGEPDDDAEETGRTAALIFAHGQFWAAGGYGLAKLR